MGSPIAYTFVCEKCVAWSCTRDDIDELRASLNMCVRRVSDVLAHSLSAYGSQTFLSNAISLIDAHATSRE